jgi:tetratricopeptide (TPR) repeat protein
MDDHQLAVHRTIAVVDVEGFGHHCRTNADQVAVRAVLYRAMREAFGRAGISWEDCRQEDRGDGLLVLIPAEVPKGLVVEALPSTLATDLRAHNQMHPGPKRIRLRMALHAGEVRYDNHGVTGASLNLAFRLLDASPLKAALAASPGVLAVIASSWFFEEVVRHSAVATTYRPVEVSVKETTATGWICLPDQAGPVALAALERFLAGAVVSRVPAAVLPPPVGRLPAEVRGRAAILEDLAELARHPDGRAHVLAGLGGSGKSTVALAVARAAAAIGLHTWWVAATDPASVASALLGLARRLGAPDGEVAEALADRVNPSDVLWPCLEAAPGWVLVLDNADDPAVLAVAGWRAGDAAGWLRPTRAGLVLVTSRSGDARTWGPIAEVHRVGPLDSPEGGQALLDLAPGAGDVSQAAGLSSRLGGLPLALHQAGTYLASPFAAQRTFESYGQVLEERFAELLGRGDDDRARVTGTWEVSLTALDGRGCPQARPLLRLLSCYAAATPIPPVLLDLDALARYCGGLAEAEDGVAGLLATGLIDVRQGASGSPPSAVVHPLVAELTRRQAGVTLDTSFGQAAWLLGAAVGHLDIEDPADRHGWQAVLPHLRFLFTVKASATESLLAGLADNAARAAAALSWTGSYLAAFELADAALKRVANLDHDSPGVLELRFRRAIAARYLGHAAEAEPELRAVLAGRQRILGANHPDTLTAEHYVAAAVSDRGHHADAEVMFRQVLAKKLDVLGPEHPSTLSTRHWIAGVLARQGRPEQAEAESRLVLDARRRILGAKHPGTLATLHDVAYYLAEQGKLSQAEAIFRQVLTDRSSVLTPDHPRTLETRYELAMTLARQDRTDDGRAMLDQVLQAQEKALGPGHPDTLRTAASIQHLQAQ